MRGDLNLVRRRGRFPPNAARRAPPSSFRATTGRQRPSIHYCRRANQAWEQEQTEETEAGGNLEIRSSGLRRGRIEAAGGEDHVQTAQTPFLLSAASLGSARSTLPFRVFRVFRGAPVRCSAFTAGNLDRARGPLRRFHGAVRVSRQTAGSVGSNPRGHASWVRPSSTRPPSFFEHGRPSSS